GAVQYAHQLDAALNSSTYFLKWMLERKLRQPRNEAHAAELRENLAPSVRYSCTRTPRSSTSDVLDRALAYELELQAFRLAEVRASRGDLGRPPYEMAYPNITHDTYGPVTQHRWHSRHDSDVLRGQIIYQCTACPGVPPAPGPNGQFPILDTLLSIPFSLLSNLPRLSAIAPYSEYQHHLIAMGSKIIQLWSRDPSPQLLVDFPITCTSPRPDWPAPVHHCSRLATTFQNMQPTIGFGPNATAARKDNGLVGVEPDSLPLEKPMIIWSSPSTDLDWEDEDEESDVNEALLVSLDPEEISKWVQGVERCQEQENPWAKMDRTPCTKGIYGGMSTNDRLMVMGALDPLVFLLFSDISSVAWNE
ncbi:hypothetical protein B0H10DRAFT_1824465, partial [Mycena sp. CBHHK59/15]